MRTKLKELSNQYVMCKGWIDGWWDLENGQRRLLIKNPIIKKPNKDLLFDNQELLSKEHHLNLFIKKTNFRYYLSIFEKLEPIYFSGRVQQYTRSDGSKDFGIYPIKQSLIHQKLHDRIEDLDEIERNCPNVYTKEFLYYLEFKRKPLVLDLLEELEEIGDLLPTFFHTYKEYKKKLTTDLICCKSDISSLRKISSSRRSRRFRKIPYDFAKEIPTFEEIKQQQQQQQLKEINQCH